MRKLKTSILLLAVFPVLVCFAQNDYRDLAKQCKIIGNTSADIGRSQTINKCSEVFASAANTFYSAGSYLIFDLPKDAKNTLITAENKLQLGLDYSCKYPDQTKSLISQANNIIKQL